MSPAELEDIVAQMAGRRVLCVGDLVLDRFVYGKASRVSREAPVMALSETRRETMLGSCGNVARNVAALGGAPVLAAVTGDDAASHEVSAILADSDIGEVELVVAPDRLTPTKTRYVAGNQQVLCVDRNPDGPIASPVEARLIEAAVGAVDHVELIILSDYGRGSVTPSVARAVIDAANARGKRVIVDPRGRDFTRYDGAYLLKPNALELSLEAGAPCGDDAEVEAALHAVMGQLKGVANLLVTRGAAGSTLLRRGAEPRSFASQPRDVFDVSGAGDTTIAALGLTLAAGVPLEGAIDVANRAAGVVVTKLGTAAVTAEELVEDARPRAPRGADIVTMEEAGRRADSWRARGLRVGLTNGCFDVLHVGHAATLAFAREACDRLIVGVNADASVRRLKGPARPVNDEDDRARLLAGMAAVDLVVIFSEDTAVRLVEAVRPQLYVKGGDYDVDALPEAVAVRAGGGEIQLAPLQPGRSTTATLAKAADENG